MPLGAPSSIIFQSAKLGDRGAILDELVWAQQHLKDTGIDRIYGVSGGVLPAVAFALAVSARLAPARFSAAVNAINDVSSFLELASSTGIRRLNLNPWHGLFRLSPLRNWFRALLAAYGLPSGMMLSELPTALYLCAADRDGTFTLFGAPNPNLTFTYSWTAVGPPSDAALIDAALAAVSTSPSSEPCRVNGSLYRDCRPAFSDARAIVADLEARAPRAIYVRPPLTPAPPWRLNWITSSFIMHRHHEQNQARLAHYYTDLLDRQRTLEQQLAISASTENPNQPITPGIHHIDLPYIGSTEAFTNMRHSVAQKSELLQLFSRILKGQLDAVDFSQPTNLIYGAGGFSGILGGLVSTRAVETGFINGGGEIRQIYGVSAGVLNGFFHAVQLGARTHPQFYTPAAQTALDDLERFFDDIRPTAIAAINLNPARFWQGWANLNPLRKFLQDRLAAYTGAGDPATLTFDDLQLRLTVAVARDDGLTDFLGTTRPQRSMKFSGAVLRPCSAPIIDSLIAGWSMNTYIQPARIGVQDYRDGGGSFYDPAIFVACMDVSLQPLLNIHLDEPEGHSYNLPERPNLLGYLFDTHNYNFPEERRRMRAITNLLYRHYATRAQARQAGVALPPDFRQNWVIPDMADDAIFSAMHSSYAKER